MSVPQEALFVVAVAAVGAVAATAVSLTIQLALIAAVAVTLTSLAMMRAGRTLNPAWIAIGWLYFVGPLGRVVTSLGWSVSTAALALLAPAPFVVAAVLLRPRSLQRLLLLTPLLLLAALAGLSLWWSADPSYGISKLTLWVATGLVPAACLLLLAPGSGGVSWRSIAAVAIAYAVLLLLFGAVEPLNPGRSTIFGANPIWAGRAALIGAVVVLFGPVPTVVKLAAVPIAVVAAVTTGSLGPMVGFVIGSLAGVAEVLRRRGLADRRVALAWVGLVLLAGLVLIVFLGGLFDPLVRDAALDPNNYSRVTLLAATGRLFGESPITGVGLGGFAATGLDLYPHNLVAEIASELGITGLLFLGAWFLLALRGAARSPLLVALVVTTTTFSLFSGSLTGNMEFWLFSTYAVAMIQLERRDTRASQTGAL